MKMPDKTDERFSSTFTSSPAPSILKEWPHVLSSTDLTASSCVCEYYIIIIFPEKKPLTFP